MKKWTVCLILALCVLLLAGASASEYSCGICTELSDYVWVSIPDESAHVRQCPHGEWIESTYGEHSGGEATCAELAACDTCGLPYGELNPENHGNYTLPMSDATSHWYVCSNGCGDMAGTGLHRAACTNPNQCVVCDRNTSDGETVINSLQHSWALAHDATHHWYACTNCEATKDTQAHDGGWATCMELAECETCGASYGELNPENHGDFSEMKSDAASHWYTCSYGCGEVTWRGLHYAKCTEPDQCAVCFRNTSDGETIINSVRHDELQDLEYAFNATHHWYACPHCSLTEGEPEAHSRNAGDPVDYCCVCLQSGVVSALKGESHQHSFTWKYDAAGHWQECECGEKRPSAPHYASCETPDQCNTCPGNKSAMADLVLTIHHSGPYTFQSVDAFNHARVCPGCGETLYTEPHYALCDQPDRCAGCGQEGSFPLEHNFVYEWVHDAEHHWMACSHCSEKTRYGKHYAQDCTDTHTCMICDRTSESETYEPKNHFFDVENYASDESNHWCVCTGCGKETLHKPHKVSCDDPTQCFECGRIGSYRVDHLWNSDYSSDGTEHWISCQLCGEVREHGAHFTWCWDENECSICEAAGSFPVQHYYGDTYEHNAAEHWVTCGDCGAIKTQAHQWLASETTAATCTVEGSVSYVCALCQETKTESLPLLEHDWRYADTTAATCEAAGRETYQCAACNLIKRNTLPALGHAFAETYVSQKDGTHAAVCTRGCGARDIQSCAFVEATFENLTYAVCSTCGYARVQATNAALPAENPAEGTRIEQAALDSGASVPDQAVLTAYDQTALLPQDTDALRLFSVSLSVNHTPVDSQGAVRVRIPCGDLTADQLANCKLMLLGADGTQTEIAFEVADGMIVFEAPLPGIFVLTPQP